MIEPPPAIRAGATRLQARLASCDWLVPIPRHFLHVWLGGPVAIGERASSWAGAGAFGIEYSGLYCFHSAVVVAARAPRLPELIEDTGLDPQTFLPHLTIAVTSQEHGAGELREVLVSLHETNLGSATVTEVKRVRFPAARRTLFAPWEVVEVVRL